MNSETSYLHCANGVGFKMREIGPEAYSSLIHLGRIPEYTSWLVTGALHRAKSRSMNSTELDVFWEGVGPGLA
jgi:hypothetical protein